jgi:hypothetical protein
MGKGHWMRDEDREDLDWHWQDIPRAEDTTPLPMTVLRGNLDHEPQPMTGSIWTFVGWGLIAASATIVIGGIALLIWWVTH